MNQSKITTNQTIGQTTKDAPRRNAPGKRKSRYAQYDRFLQENPNCLNDDVISPIANRIHKLLGDANYINVTKLTPFNIGLIVFQAAAYGDWFGELVFDPDYPKPLLWQNLPCDSMYRIQTVSGQLLEFQQSKEGPDYQSITRSSIEKATKEDLMKATAIRFQPREIVHIRPMCHKYAPYGTSCLEINRYHKSGDVVLGNPVLRNDFEYEVTEGIKELASHFIK